MLATKRDFVADAENAKRGYKFAACPHAASSRVSGSAFKPQPRTTAARLRLPTTTNLPASVRLQLGREGGDSRLHFRDGNEAPRTRPAIPRSNSIASVWPVRAAKGREKEAPRRAPRGRFKSTACEKLAENLDCRIILGQCLKFRERVWNKVLESIPNMGKINTEILMNEDISKSGHSRPVNI